MSEDPSGAEKLLHEAFRETCKRCGSITPRDYAFCSTCGRENIAFSEAYLMEQFGVTLEQAREKCRGGHKELLEALAEHPGDGAVTPYCPLCGKAVTMN